MEESDIELQESIAALLEGVPEPVREFVLSDLADKVRSLVSQYNLHIDTGGVLQRELLLLLVGEEEPSDFAKELRDSNIPEETVTAIIRDINETVFKKLQEQERSQPVVVRQPSQPLVQLMQVGASTAEAARAPQTVAPNAGLGTTVSPGPSPQAPDYAIGYASQTEYAYGMPAAGSAEYQVPGQPTPSQQFIAPPQPLPAALSQQETAVQAPVATVPHLHPRTMAEDMRMASEGLHPGAAMPARSFQTASVPVTSSYAAPSQPTTPQRSPLSEPQKTIAPVVQNIPSSNTPQAPVPQFAPPKGYGGDPYREPLA